VPKGAGRVFEPEHVASGILILSCDVRLCIVNGGGSILKGGTLDTVAEAAGCTCGLGDCLFGEVLEW
jgi:hypothetical protein